jgi:hypothetical protein
LGTTGSENGDIIFQDSVNAGFQPNSLFVTSANNITINDTVLVSCGGNLKFVANNDITLGNNTVITAGDGNNLVFAVDQGSSSSIGPGKLTMSSSTMVNAGTGPVKGKVYFYVGNLAISTFGGDVAGVSFVPGQYTSVGTFPGISGTLPTITSPYAIYYKGLGTTVIPVTPGTQGLINQSTANVFSFIGNSGNWTLTNGTYKLDIAGLTEDLQIIDIGNLTTAQIQALTADQVASLTTGQINSLTGDQITAFQQTQYSKLSIDKLGTFINREITLTKAAVNNFAENAKAALEAAQAATDAANAATDAANLAAEAADAATVAAEEARDAADAATAAVEELAVQVKQLMAALKEQVTTLANTVAKIAKKVKQ